MVPEGRKVQDNFHDKIPPQTRTCAWLRKWQQPIERNQLNIKQNSRRLRLGHDLRESIRARVNQWLIVLECLARTEEIVSAWTLEN